MYLLYFRTTFIFIHLIEYVKKGHILHNTTYILHTTYSHLFYILPDLRERYVGVTTPDNTKKKLSYIHTHYHYIIKMKNIKITNKIYTCR